MFYDVYSLDSECHRAMSIVDVLIPTRFMKLTLQKQIIYYTKTIQETGILDVIEAPIESDIDAHLVRVKNLFHEELPAMPTTMKLLREVTLKDAPVSVCQSRTSTYVGTLENH